MQLVPRFSTATLRDFQLAYTALRDEMRVPGGTEAGSAGREPAEG